MALKSPKSEKLKKNQIATIKGTKPNSEVVLNVKNDKPPDSNSKNKIRNERNTKRNERRKARYVRKNLSNIPKNELRILEIKQITEERMKNLGVYHSSYDDVIHIYSNMIYEYERCLEQFEEEGKVYEVDTGTGSTKKSGIVSAMEILRKDIGTYSDRLQLNPKSSGKIVAEESDKMSQFLSEFN